MSHPLLPIIALVASSCAMAFGQDSSSSLERLSLDEMRKRSQGLIEQQARYAKGVEDGTIDRHADLRAKWPDLVAQVAELEGIRESLSSEAGDTEKLTMDLYGGLQKVGPYLDFADIPDEVALYMRRLSDEQVAEINTISDEMDEVRAASPDDVGNESRLSLVGPDQRYTMLFLSVPIEVRAPPGSDVYFRAEAGGHFLSNGIAYRKVKADENGLAVVNWVSQGSASGDSGIQVRSASAINSLYLEIRVVDLRLEIPKGFTP